MNAPKPKIKNCGDSSPKLIKEKTMFSEIFKTMYVRRKNVDC
jgi:hypothetical protein